MKGIRETLLPALRSHGFEIIPLTEQERSGELPSAFPFGRLRRARGTGFDVAEIQMKRHGGPAFRIIAGVVPSTGINHPVGYVPAENVWASHLPQHYMLLGFPFTGRWFSLWHWPKRQVTVGDIDTLVADTTKSIVPELEIALRDGRCGRHVKIIGR